MCHVSSVFTLPLLSICFFVFLRLVVSPFTPSLNWTHFLRTYKFTTFISSFKGLAKRWNVLSFFLVNIAHLSARLTQGKLFFSHFRKYLVSSELSYGFLRAFFLEFRPRADGMLFVMYAFTKAARSLREIGEHGLTTVTVTVFLCHTDLEGSTAVAYPFKRGSKSSF